MINNKKEKHLEEAMNIKKGYTPTRQLCGVFQALWTVRNNKAYKFTGEDNKTAQRLWRQCKKDNPKNPLEYFTERVRAIMEQHDIYSFGGIEQFWNSTTAKKKSKSWID